jgi:hypothetical protein
MFYVGSMLDQPAYLSINQVRTGFFFDEGYACALLLPVTLTVTAQIVIYSSKRNFDRGRLPKETIETGFFFCTTLTIYRTLIGG